MTSSSHKFPRRLTPGRHAACRWGRPGRLWGPACRLPDEAATDRLGRRLAAVLRTGSVVGLNGELGAGKTRLVRAVALAAGVDSAC